MRKRLFLALTVFSMTLAGCDAPQDVAPPDDQNQEEGVGDSSGEGETPKVEELTPEQQRNSNQIYTYVSMGLGLTGQKSKGIETYIASYCDEIAIKDIKSETIQSIALELADVFTETIDAQKVFDLLCSFKENEILKDASYFAVAFAKSYGRSFAYASEENADMINSLLDKVDLEKQNVHSNLYSTLDVSLDAYNDFTSDEFTGLVKEAYSDDNKVVDKVKAKELMVYVGESLDRVANIETNVKYFASLAEKLFKVEPQTRALTSETSGINDAITMLFDGIRSLSSLLEYYGDAENSDLNVVFDIVNYILEGNWQSALTTGATTLIKTGLSLIGLENEYTSLLLNAGPFILLPSYLKESFTSDEFTQMINSLKETFTVDGLKDVIGEVVNIVSTLSYLKDSFLYLNEFVGKCIVQIGTMFYELSEDEAQTLVEKFDVSSYIETAFDYYDSILSVVANLDDSFYDVIQFIIDKNYEEVARQIINAVFTLIGSSTTFESVKEDVDAIGNTVTNIFESFVADSFKEKVASIINEETHELDNTKLKEVITDVATILEDILNIKENVTNFGEQLLDVVRQLLLTVGFSEDKINALFEDVDVSIIVELVFEKLSEVISLIKDLGNEESKLDAYIPLINSLIAIINAEDIGSAFLPFNNFLVNGFTLLFDKLGMEDKEPTQYATDVLMLLGSFVSSYLSFSSEEFINKAKAIYNSETHEVDFDALETFLTSVGTNLSIYAANDFKNILFEFVDLFREVASKLQPENPSEEAQAPENIEGSESEEEQGEPEEPKDAVKDAITKFVDVMKVISDYLNSENEQFKEDLALLQEAYDVVMTAINNISAIAGDANKKLPEKAAEIYDEVLNAIKGLLDVAEKKIPQASEYEQYFVSKYVEFAKEVVYVIANVIENRPSVIEKDFVIELASYLALALPGSTQGSANSCNIDYFDNVVMPGILPVEEIKQALANKEEGEWEAELKEFSVSFEKITVIDGEETRIEYCLSFNTLKSYHITNTVVNDENVLSVEILYDYVSVKIPSLDFIPVNVASTIGLLLLLSDSIDEKIDEYTSYINKFIDIYKAVTEGNEQETTFDEILNLVEQFSKEDGALVKTLCKDVLFAVLSLASAFVPNAEKVAQIDFTSYLFNAFLKLDLISEKSFTEGQVESFKALLKDVYEVASIFDLRDELIAFLKETFFFDDIEEFETSDEFVEYFDEIFAELIIPSETPELGA